MPYFTIANGLTGCYLADSAFTIQAATRRELKSALEGEAYYIRDAGGVGLNKRAIAWLANAAWKGRKDSKERVAPYRWKYQTHYPYGLSVWGASRAEYRAQDEY